MRRRSGRTGGLALYFAALAVGAAMAVVLGVVRSDAGMAVFGAPLVLLFGFGAWILSPRQVRSGKRWRVFGYQDAFFRRLGIEWLTGPQRDRQEDQGPDR